MIWDRIPTSGIAFSYQSYLLALRGAMGVAQSYLQSGAVIALREGRGAIVRASEVYVPMLQKFAQDAIASAWDAGVKDAGIEESLPAPDLGHAAATVENLAGRDALKAIEMSQKQALHYDILRRRGESHVKALLEVAGDVGGDVFKQLDRAQRRFESGGFVLGAVREQAAQMYLEGFLAAAARAGLQRCFVVEPGRTDLLVSLADDLPLLRALFHPNAQCKLRAEAS